MITDNMRPITQEDIKVLGRIVNISTEGIVADAVQIWDSEWIYNDRDHSPNPSGADQSWINKWLKNYIDSILNGDYEFDHINVKNWIKSPSMYVDNIYPYTDGGNVNINSDLHVDGNLDVTHKITGNELEISGNSNLNTLHVSGNAWFESLVYFAKGIRVTSGGIEVHGDSKFYNDVDIDGSLHVHTNLTVDGDTILNNLTVNGSITVNGTDIDLSDILRRLEYLEECCEEMHNKPAAKYTISWVANNQDGTRVANGSIADLTAGASSSRTVLTGYNILSVSPSSGSVYGDTTGKITWSNIDGNANVVFTVEGHDAPTVVNPTSVTVQDITVYVGETANAQVTVLPSNATDKSVTYSIADTSKATVNVNGVVTGVAVGNTTITVTTSNGLTATANVTVLERGGGEPTTRTLNIIYIIDGIENNFASQQILTSQYTVSEPTLNGYTLTNITTTLGTVNNDNTVTIPAGTDSVTITYTWVNNSGQKTLRSISIDPDLIELFVGETYNDGFNVTVQDEGVDYVLTWRSEDDSIATIDENKVVTGVSVGTTYIIFTATDPSDANNYVTFSVTVVVKERAKILNSQGSDNVTFDAFGSMLTATDLGSVDYSKFNDTVSYFKSRKDIPVSMYGDHSLEEIGNYTLSFDKNVGITKEDLEDLISKFVITYAPLTGTTSNVITSTQDYLHIDSTIAEDSGHWYINILCDPWDEAINQKYQNGRGFEREAVITATARDNSTATWNIKQQVRYGIFAMANAANRYLKNNSLTYATVPSSELVGPGEFQNNGDVSTFYVDADGVTIPSLAVCHTTVLPYYGWSGDVTYTSNSDWLSITPVPNAKDAGYYFDGDPHGCIWTLHADQNTGEARYGTVIAKVESNSGYPTSYYKLIVNQAAA